MGKCCSREVPRTGLRKRTVSPYERGLIEASLDPLVTISPDGRITDVNKATEEVTGISRTGLIGTDFSDYFTIPEKAKEGYRKVLSEGVVRDYPLTIKHVSGKTTEVLYNATIYRNDAGDVQGIFAAARDATERRKAEEEARLNLIRQKALLDLYQKMAAAPIPEIISFVVDKCVNLTESTIGFVGLISDDNTHMEAHLWSERAMEECPINRPLHFSLRDAGIWAEPIRQRKAMIINDYPAPNPYKKGYPQGHLDLVRFMGVPVVENNRVVAVAGVANKREGYAESDLNKVSLLLEGMWDLIMRKRAEEKLRLAGAYHRSLIEASLDPLVTIGPDGKITDVNGATEEVTGHTRNELIGTDFCTYFTDPDAALRGYQGVFKEGSVRDYPLEILHRDGKVTPVLYNATIYRNESGEVQGVFAAARDITERIRAEEELRKSEAELKEAQRVAGMGSWELDWKTGAVTWSEEIYRIFGRDPALGVPAYKEHAQILTSASMTLLESAIEKILHRTGGFFEVDLELIRPDGSTRWIAARGEIKHRKEDLIVLRGTALDITERRRLEEQLRQAQKMEAVGQLAGGIAHDFNNILSAIVGYGNLLQMKLGAGDPLRQYGDQILECADRASSLTRSLLAFSRKQIIYMRPVDVNEIVEKVRVFLGRIIGEDVELATRLSGGGTAGSGRHRPDRAGPDESGDKREGRDAERRDILD